MKIYAISGLGADKRVFQFLKLEHEFIPIDWIDPLKNESIAEYAKRFSSIIEELSSWKNNQRVEKVLKIVGTKDKLIPLKNEENIELIEGGGHLMIIDNADEVSAIINKELKKLH